MRRKVKPKGSENCGNQVQYISGFSATQLTSSLSSSSKISSNSSNSETSKASKMVTNNNATDAMPSAPSAGLVLFDSEDQSDIVFIVGNEADNVWRFPAHSFIVENASHIFRALVQSGRNDRNQQNIRITWCKPEIFYIILRHIYTNEVTLTSVSNALVLFTTSNQFLLTELSRICLTFLYDNCNDENVLEIVSHFSHSSYLCLSSNMKENNIPHENSEEPVSRQSSNNWDNILYELITECYLTLDSEAKNIISSEVFSSLDYELVLKILSRDTLNISSELDVFESIMLWSCHECKKQCKPLTGDNKRSVLGELLYCPRYLAMTVDEFNKHPNNSNVLTEQEKSALLARLTGDSQPLPHHLVGRKLDKARKFVGPEYIWVDGLALILMRL